MNTAPHFLARIYLILTLAAIAASPALAQSTNAPLNEDYYHRIDRYEIKSGSLVKPIFTTIKPYKRQAIVATLDSLPDGTFSSPADKFNRTYLLNDNWEWSDNAENESIKPFLGMYKKKSDLYHVREKDFDLHVNPVLYVGMGKDTRMKNSLFVNTRGLEVRGMVDNKIGFYAYLTDNQARLPLYVTEWGQLFGHYVVPHQGFWKDFKKDGIDFFDARGYIDVNLSKHVYLQFGHDRTFIGNGLRSLILSDFAPPMQFLRTNVKVWKLNYLFQLNRMTADAYGTAGGSTSRQRYPDKYMAFHHLSVNVSRKLSIGVFESIVFSPQDTINGGVFELNYLNPVIFYRAIEQQNGSADNALVGMDVKWLPIRNVEVYGQFLLDEFVLSNFTSGNGWWANKYAVQAGVKYIDVAGIPNLDLQLETNIVRPYTYSHKNLFTSYSHFLQPLAHPLGANFSEVIGIVRYQPIPKLQLTLKGSYAQAGRDNASSDPLEVNWGGDILKSYNTRVQEFNNVIGQGNLNKILYADFLASYMVRHNLFIDARATYRKSSSNYLVFENSTTAATLALRWNIPARSYDF